MTSESSCSISIFLAIFDLNPTTHILSKIKPIPFACSVKSHYKYFDEPTHYLSYVMKICPLIKCKIEKEFSLFYCITQVNQFYYRVLA